MTFKSLIKNILPHFIVARYQANLPTTPEYLKYLQLGNSIIQESFGIKVINPQDRKYVVVGNDDVLNPG